MSDFEKLINASDLFDWIMETYPDWCVGAIRGIVDHIKKMPSAQPEQRWIPCSERLPETTDPVIITWVNHKPEVYYEYIKDKPFVATGHYYNGRWYWFSVACQDYLDEYGDCEMDRIDSAVEIIAWMPLASPYKEENR